MKHSNAPTINFVLAFVFGVAPLCTHAHAVGTYAIHPIEWRNDQIRQVTTWGSVGEHIAVEGKDCIAAENLNFNVRDDYAFDIDETVWLDLDLYSRSTDGYLSVSYDGHGISSTKEMKQVQLPSATDMHLHKQSIRLERARFANLELGGSDFRISTRSGAHSTAPHDVAICSLSLRRSYTTAVTTEFGWVTIEVVDEKAEPTPARMGIYDAFGRLPLPSDEAVMLRNSAGADRVKSLPPVTPWPVKNRSVFYTDGYYQSRLAAGEYELIVAKGPEYRLATRRFTVARGKSQTLRIPLSRWIDMPGKGWYSGDGHIHYARESAYDDRNLQLFAQAEDVRVSNVLQMGNISSSYFGQHEWSPLVTSRAPLFVLAPGQEDPRTEYRGHTVQLNIRQPVRNADRYLLYHETFEGVRAQGGLTGYAHVTSDYSWINAATGLALDVPFGLVDLVEILSQTTTPDPVWFDFLNLGYKLSPTAGSDYVGVGITDLIGYVRNYVHVTKEFTPQAWFDALKAGQTFVTNGPMLGMDINGHGMGSEIHLKRGEPLVIKAQASVSPDMGGLSAVELIEQGEVIKSISPRGENLVINLRHDLQAKHGTWFTLRAQGKSTGAIAMSAPIYIFVDGQSFWKPKDVPTIVTKLKLKMQGLLAPPRTREIVNEEWEARKPLVSHWESQQDALKTRVEQASLIYDDLAKQAAKSPAQH